MHNISRDPTALSRAPLVGYASTSKSYAKFKNYMMQLKSFIEEKKHCNGNLLGTIILMLIVFTVDSSVIKMYKG